MTVVKVTLLDCSAPLWRLSTSQRQLWRKEDGTLMVSGQPVEAVEVDGDTVTLRGWAGRWWSISRADYEKVRT